MTFDIGIKILSYIKSIIPLGTQGYEYNYKASDK
jgi:hypothetical protein